MAQNYGYETLMTELPTYMKQVLRFSIKEVSCKWEQSFQLGLETLTSLLCELIIILDQLQNYFLGSFINDVQLFRGFNAMLYFIIVCLFEYFMREGEGIFFYGRHK